MSTRENARGPFRWVAHQLIRKSARTDHSLDENRPWIEMAPCMVHVVGMRIVDAPRSGESAHGLPACLLPEPTTNSGIFRLVPALIDEKNPGHIPLVI